MLQCFKCGAVVHRPPSVVKNNKTGRFFCSANCHHTYTGRNRVANTGYRMVSVGNGNRFLEHRVVAEKMIGRKLARNEVVHHIDGDRLNNSESNLLVMTKKQHQEHHKCKKVDVEHFLSMKSEGLTNEEIAKKLGMDRGTLGDALKRAGIKFTQSDTFTKLPEAKTLSRHGFCIRTIANILKFSPKTITNNFSRDGFEYHGRSFKCHGEAKRNIHG